MNTGILPKTRILWSPRGFNSMRKVIVLYNCAAYCILPVVPTVWIVAQSGDVGLLQLLRKLALAKEHSRQLSGSSAAYWSWHSCRSRKELFPALTALISQIPNLRRYGEAAWLRRRSPYGMTGTLEGVLQQRPERGNLGRN